ncbi:FAD-dependent oxidoreductase [Sneathiella chungangensis]|uniref:FAD-dependent oxidoreductase n=1 Tax=Sneathiella chungangensis TaxID=1418234 RepID=A0A845MEK8_9PROT|nr:FAD-dependent oxidoreductase [Sneathiella chungangensis]MZR21810.1 FAD-dependent oxidoreductase [Sneathiella chungangensis]
MRIAVLGAGIMGSSLAILLARRGADVTLFNKDDAPMMGASRWNEGKIHLGYIYAGDPTLASARHVLSGGVSFAPIVSDILQTDIRSFSTEEDDIFVLHRDSVVGEGEFKDYHKKLDDLAGSHPDAKNYFGNLPGCNSRQLSTKELEAIADPETAVAAFRVPERSVQTETIGDLYKAALAADRKIDLKTSFTVTDVKPEDLNNGSWQVTGIKDTGQEVHGGYDCVINALWYGRMDLDAKVGLPPTGIWSNRYRVSLFIKTKKPVDTPSAFIAVGAFGDVKNYDGRSFYMSWYPAGLLIDSADVLPKMPEPLTHEQKNVIIENIRSGIATVLNGTDEIFDAAQEIKVEGGFVFAQGKGSIAKRSSTLHFRDKFGINRKGSYISIDTGKYSSAPELAAIITKELIG